MLLLPCLFARDAKPIGPREQRDADFCGDVDDLHRELRARAGPATNPVAESGIELPLRPRYEIAVIRTLRFVFLAAAASSSG